MTKLIAPLMSEKASGTIAEGLTFSSRKTGPQVRWQKKQRDVLTAPREAVRLNFSCASEACRFTDYGVIIFGSCLFGNEIGLYVDMAEKKKISAYNQCIAEYSI